MAKQKQQQSFLQNTFTPYYEAPTPLTEPYEISRTTAPAIDTMSNFEALGLTISTGYNMLQKHLFDRQAATREAPANTQDEILSAIVKEQDPYMYSGLISGIDDYKSLTDVAYRKQYLQKVKDAQEQSYRNFGTVGTLVYGLPFAIADVDSIPLALAGAGIGYANKALSITSKAARVAQSALGAGFIGAESTYSYEAVTGVKYKDSITDNFLIGAALGGTLGLVLDHSKAPGQTTINPIDGKEIKNAKELKTQLINEMANNQNRIDKAIDIKKAIDDTLNVHQKDLEEALTKDRSKLEPVLQKVTDTLQAKIDEAQGKLTETTNKISTSTTNVGVLKEELKTLNSELKPLLNKSTIIEKAKTGLSQIQTKIEEALVKKQELVDKVKNVNLVSMGRSSLLIQQIAKNNEVLTKQIVAIDKEISKLNKQASKISNIQELSKEEKASITNLQQRIAETTSKLDKETTSITQNKEALKQQVAEHKKQTNIKKVFDKNWDKTKIPLSADTKTIMDKLNKARDWKSILKQKELLTEEEAKMLKGDFSLANLKDMYVNKIDQTAKELKELGDVVEKNELSKLPIFNEVPKWYKNLLISPIEKLKNSDNRYVAGLASLLHNGTVSMGKALTFTADNVKKELDMLFNQKVENALREDWIEARKNNRFSGNFEEYSIKVSQEAYQTIGMMKKKAFEGIQAGLSHKEFMKRFDENLLSMNRIFTDEGNIEINKSINSMLDYFEEIWSRGHLLNMVGFINTLKSGYIPRFYNVEAILKMGREEAINRLFTAQMKFASRANRNITDGLRNEFLIKATNAIDSALEGIDVAKSIVEPFKTLSGINEQTLTSLETGRVNSRKIELFEDDIIDLLDHDAVAISGSYAMGMHGRIALKERLGIETSKEFEDLLTKVGATPDEKDNFRVITDTILNRREIVKNPFDPVARTVKGLSSVSSLLHSAAFGVAQVTEMAQLMAEFGFNRTMKYLFQDVGNIYDLYSKGTVADKNQIKLIGSYGESLFHYKAGRLEADGMLDSVGRIQQFIDKSVHKLSLLSGMAPLTDLMKLMSSSMTTDFLARASVRKLSPTDLQRVLDMGFDTKDLEELRRVLQVDKDGNIGNMDRNTWGDIDRKLTHAGLTTIDRTVLHPSGATLPKFMTNYEGGAIVPRLLMKFLRFPVESYERLLVRGLQNFDAKQLIALGANMGMWYLILQTKDAVREQTQGTSLETGKPLYAGIDGQQKLLRDTLLSTSMVSAPTMLADRVYAALTGRTLSGYEAALSAPTSDFRKLTQGKINFSIPFWTFKIDIGKAASNHLNNLNLLNELWDGTDEQTPLATPYSDIVNQSNKYNIGNNQ